MNGKPEHWKQQNAIDQFTVLRFALDGHLINFEMNIIDKKTFIEKAQTLIDEMHLLDPYLKGKKW